MSTVYNPDAGDIKKLSLAMLAAIAMFGVLGPAIFPGFWWLYEALLALAVINTLAMIYLNESYTVFVIRYLSCLIFLLAFASACFAYMLIVNELGGSGLQGAIVGGSLLVFALSLYVLIYRARSSKLPFHVSGNRVSLSASDSTGGRAGLIAGAGTVFASVIIQRFSSLTVSAMVATGFFFCCIAMLVYSRHRIAGLRTLRIQEKTMSTPYTFMQIEEIREARGRWWISRFFKWLGSRYKSPSA